MNYAEMSDYDINEACAKIIGKEAGGYFFPCWEWADAGTIIQDNQINLNSITTGWIASDNGAHDCNYSIHESPLRSAMIVFLMMQERK